MTVQQATQQEMEIRSAESTSTVRSVCVVLPTYNEVDNVGAIVRELLTLFDQHSEMALTIVVVDDDSPDGTGAVVAQLAADDARVTLLSGPKQGLGAAYSRGFEHVLGTTQVDVVVQMDADFSHAPGDLPRLLQELHRADVVIGSRYVMGGSIDERWSWQRRAMSWLGNVLARNVAGMYRVRDCTAGFRAIRMSALARVLPLRVSLQGYMFSVALLHALILSGARVVELPVHFTDRVAGQTKLGWRDIVEFFVHVWWLRLLSGKTFVKYALTGASGVVVNLVSFQALLMVGANPYLSSALAIELSIISNFLLNNFWTFRDRVIRARRRIRGLKFNVVSLLTLGLSFSTFVLLRWLWPDDPAWTAQLLSIPPAMLANYFANSYWTFRDEAV